MTCLLDFFFFSRYPPTKFKVLAFTGAPGSFPIRERDLPLHKYLRWSDNIEEAAEKFISEKIQRPYLGIHMRNGPDWVGVISQA